MSELTKYSLNDGVAGITLDDGKVNALSVAMLGEISSRLDQAQSEASVVILTGRERTFSAGFDLRSQDWPPMLTAGATLAQRLLSFPLPVVIACTGNAMAMGAFLLLAADHRIGARGEFRIGLNEVAIGLTMPWFGIALARHRLNPPAFDRCTITGAILDPSGAREAGFLDEVVEPADLENRAHEVAAQLTLLDRPAHAATKLRIRDRALAELADGLARIDDPDREI